MSKPNAHQALDSALAAWLLPTTSGRRVVWVGDAGSPALEELSRYAGRLKVLDTAGREGRQRNLRVRNAREGFSELSPTSVDILVLQDIDVLESRSRLVERLREVVSGFAVLTLRVDDPELEPLLTQVRLAFGEVRIFGQRPFVGCVVADVEEAPAQIVIDDTRGDRETIARLVVVAGDDLPVLDSFFLGELASDTSVSASPDPREANERKERALREALERAEGRLSQLQGVLVHTETQLAEARASTASKHAENEVQQLEQKLQHVGALLRDAKDEQNRLRVLVRDLTEELARRAALHVQGQGTEALVDALSARVAAEMSRDEAFQSALAYQQELERCRSECRQLREEVAAFEREQSSLARRIRTLEPIALERRQIELRFDESAAAAVADASLWEGRVAGLRFRVRDADMSIASLLAFADNLRGRDLVAECEARELEISRLTLALVDAQSAHQSDAEKVSSLTERLAAREAFLSRLNRDLSEAENRLRDSEAVARRREHEAARLRESLLAAADTVEGKETAERLLAEAGHGLKETELRLHASEAARLTLEAEFQRTIERERVLQHEIRELQNAAASLQSEEHHASVQAALAADETLRRMSADFAAEKAVFLSERDMLRSEKERAEALLGAQQTVVQSAEQALLGAKSALSQLIASGGEFDEDPRERLLRSLALQLEERDDHVRALEARLSDKGSVGADEALRRQALELEERALRLREELRQEREARALAEREMERVSKGTLLATDAQKELSERAIELRNEAEKRASMEADRARLVSLMEEVQSAVEEAMNFLAPTADAVAFARLKSALAALARR